MFRYHLRTLLILLTVTPPLLAWSWAVVVPFAAKYWPRKPDEWTEVSGPGIVAECSVDPSEFGSAVDRTSFDEEMAKVTMLRKGTVDGSDVFIGWPLDWEAIDSKRRKYEAFINEHGRFVDGARTVDPTIPTAEEIFVQMANGGN